MQEEIYKSAPKVGKPDTYRLPSLFWLFMQNPEKTSTRSRCTHHEDGIRTATRRNSDVFADVPAGLAHA